jgi:DNA segregation ATPase FtsK/SpoIIIE-like protein
MKYEHKAIIDKAKQEGLAPSELASELLVHDLLNSALGVIRGHAVAFKNMSEQQQDAAIQTMQDEFKKAVGTAIRIIASAGTKTVRMQLKKVAIGTKYQIQGIAEGTEEHLHALCDKAQDQSDVLIVLYESDYEQGLDAIKGEKDQKDLPLDGQAQKAKKPAAAKPAKTIELTPGLVEHAKEFVLKFQNVTIPGLQNQLKIDIDKANALHVELEKLGILSAPDEKGERKLIRSGDQQQSSEPSTGANAGDPLATIDDETYVKVKAKVIADKRISVGFLQTEFALGEEQARAAIARLEADGVVGEENELGGRAVLVEA